MNEHASPRGPRFYQLMFAEMICLSRGIAYTAFGTNDLPLGLDKLNGPFPIWVAGIAWLAVAVLIPILAIYRNRAPMLFAIACAPAFLWAVAYGVGYLMAGIPNDRSWISVFIYWGVSGMIFWSCMSTPPRGWVLRRGAN